LVVRLLTECSNRVGIPGINFGAAQGWLETRKRNRSNDLN
jgi:hypothetical protein